MKIDVLIIDPVTRSLSAATIDNELDDLQKAVGGYIEMVVFAPGIDLWVDEEGRLKELNHGFLFPGMLEPIMGRGVLAGRDEEGQTISFPEGVSVLTLASLINWYEGPSPKPHFEVYVKGDA